MPKCPYCKKRMSIFTDVSAFNGEIAVLDFVCDACGKPFSVEYNYGRYLDEDKDVIRTVIE